MRSKLYRLVTSGFDVTVRFESREAALEEAKKRAAYHPIKLYSKGLNGDWVLFFDSERKEVSNE